MDLQLPLWFEITSIVVLILIVIADLVLAYKRPHIPSTKESSLWVGFYVFLAVIFAVLMFFFAGAEPAGQFVAGWLTEYSLSIDNLFVFVIIMNTFAVPEEHQQKILIFGIAMALVMRVIFIALGAALLELFSFMFLVFGLVLVVTALQLYRHRDVDPDVGDNGLVRLARRVLPVSDDYDGGRIITRSAGHRAVSPLFIVLLAIGSSDLLFALDSIPAVFGVTNEAYIVVTANAFALLGLRPLFFLVKGLLDRLVYLSTGLALILAFIGVKLVLHWGHGFDNRVPVISTNLSLAVIVVVLTVTTVASLRKVRRDPNARAHAGSLRAREPADPRMPG